MPEKEITYEEVRKWILLNSDDVERMDALNKLTYPFTSKYSSQTTR